MHVKERIGLHGVAWTCGQKHLITTLTLIIKLQIDLDIIIGKGKWEDIMGHHL